ncbi:sigma-70 family RNA polymerase sigma factor [Paenibacillus sp. 1011MAR3C5]|uniref:RNA polymerase sigma factor SigJ n=1 Tax=Paenibacillus sp. 1011MAR3C5 TaxID=1675787 RepID=UPI000E6BA93D|nr:RNA polymerase sigma factor SigJ [Paenibacillus sp. 1011MAR3C5]RJE87468.1 sigma-70 family RNA polymerase sigma factor [Paenibacillus sp. 1011MAR3C5]
MQKLYEQYRRLLFALAYQMTGSVSDAEDVVQDVFLKAYAAGVLDDLDNPKAYLCRMASNRCRDVLRSARKKREQYFGPWLPEPVLASYESIDDSILQHELLSYGMLVLLERLSPSERAVFVLREALGFSYADIASMIEMSEANCRKLLSRARTKMGVSGVSAEELAPVEGASEEWIARFLMALQQNHVEKVTAMLAEDVTLISDGGGKAVAAVHPIESSERVMRFLAGLIRSMQVEEGRAQLAMERINGQAGLVIRSGDRVETVVLLDMREDRIQHIYFVRNPDKLARI